MSELWAGAGSDTVEPGAEHVDNSLHSVMTVRSDLRGSPLRAKAIVLRFGEVGALLLSLDHVGLSTRHCDVLRAELCQVSGIDKAGIVIHCTHSHSTPFAEPLGGATPFFDLLRVSASRATAAATAALQPARIGFGQTFAVGASYNTRYPLADGGTKFIRDYREGLSSGRPIDPRLSVMRIDDANGAPLAGWVRFAAHPSVVIFDAPISAEFPGYLTDRLAAANTAGAPVSFNVGACGDVNPIPMFGSEADCRQLGLSLASLAGPVFDAIETRVPDHLGIVAGSVELPLELAPSDAVLDREIAELDAFSTGLDRDPRLEWVLGVNVIADWPAELKRNHFRPVRDWAVAVKALRARGEQLPLAWTSPMTALVVDGTGLVFYGGEPFVEVAMELARRSRLDETLLMALSNGGDGYVPTDDELRRGGYEAYTSPRYSKLAPDARPLPYRPGAGERLVAAALALLERAQRRPGGPAGQR